jgi:hypothetical protein
VKRNDLFGHKIQLRFNNQTRAHNTFCGGICSLLLKLMIFVYTLMLTSRVFLERDGRFSSNFKSMEELPGNQTDRGIPAKDEIKNLNQILFITITDGKTREAIDYKDLTDVISVESTFKNKSLTVRECTLRDFNGDRK